MADTASNDVALVAQQVGYEQKAFWRNPAAAGFTVIFPLLFLVIFSLTSNSSTITVGHQGGHPLKVHGIQYFAAGLLAFGLITACYTSLSINLTTRRDEGILKRKRGTPLPAWAFITGVVGNAMIVGLFLTVVVTAFGRLAYSLNVPGSRLVTLVVVLLVGSAAFCALGILLTCFIPNADAAPSIANISIFPLIFISGVFFPVDNDTLNRIADVFPVRHFIKGLNTVFGTPIGHQAPGLLHLPWKDLAVVAAWGVVGAVVAARRFRWEPKRG